MSLDVAEDGVVPETCADNACARAELKRASNLFLFEERTLDSPFVQKVWRTRSEPAPAFISVAVSHWEMVVTHERGRTYMAVRGPETRATTALIPQDAEFFGIQFKLGAFMPNLPIGPLVDGKATLLPDATSGSFRLNGSAWDLPRFDDADLFVNRLVREGLLVRDPVVEAALQGYTNDLSERSVQRRVLRATGLTQAAIRQIERAEAAVDLLEQGVPILETVARTGYADQAHLTRSLKRFIGQTPLQIVRMVPSR